MSASPSPPPLQAQHPSIRHAIHSFHPISNSAATPTPMVRPLDPRIYSTGGITRTPIGGVPPLAPNRIPVWNLRAPVRSPTPPSPSYSPFPPVEAPVPPEPVTPPRRDEVQDAVDNTRVARPPRSPETMRRQRLAAMVAKMGERTFIGEKVAPEDFVDREQSKAFQPNESRRPEHLNQFPLPKHRYFKPKFTPPSNLKRLNTLPPTFRTQWTTGNQLQCLYDSFYRAYPGAICSWQDVRKRVGEREGTGEEDEVVPGTEARVDEEEEEEEREALERWHN
ncbi:hypothetical protein B9479_006521, partial [Cryptococcus floricola]